MVENEFEEKLPNTESLKDKLTYIKFALFSNEYNKMTNKIISAEKLIEDKYIYIMERNKSIYNLVNTKFQYLNKKEGDQPILATELNFGILNNIIKSLTEIYEQQNKNHYAKCEIFNSKSYQHNDDNTGTTNVMSGTANVMSGTILKSKSKIRLKEHSIFDMPKIFAPLTLRKVHMMIHQIKLSELYKKESPILKISYNGQENYVHLVDEFDNRYIHGEYLNHYYVFEIKDTYSIARELHLEMINSHEYKATNVDNHIKENDQQNRLITIDLSIIEIGVLTKLQLKFDNPANLYMNESLLSSTISLSILLDNSEIDIYNPRTSTSVKSRDTLNEDSFHRPSKSSVQSFFSNYFNTGMESKNDFSRYQSIIPFKSKKILILLFLHYVK